MLTKKERKKRINKKNILDKHIFSGMTEATTQAFEDNMGGAIAGLTSAAGTAIGAGVQQSQLEGVEEAQAVINEKNNFQSSAVDKASLLEEMSGMRDVRTDYTRKDFMQSGANMAMNTFSSMLSGAGSGAAAGPWGAVAGAGASLITNAIGMITQAIGAKKQAKKTNEAGEKANLTAAHTTTAKAASLDQAADDVSQRAYAAYGGDINTPKFPDFPSEITEFNTGGSHEENPYDGIPQGIAPDGLPNLVEEGEVKYDNYIFSDRLMLNKNDKKKYKFLKGKTYADAAKAIKKELGIDERPNDLIAKADLEEQLSLLSTLQEEERAKRGLRGENRMMYKNGGHIFDSMHDILSGLSRKQAIDKLANTTFNYTDDAGNTRTWTNPGNRSSAKAYYNSLGLNSGGDWSSILQAAPAVGGTIGTIASIPTKSDFKYTNILTKPEKPVSSVTFSPSLQRIQYKPTDLNPLLNKVAAQSAANRASITQSSTNPYTAYAGILANDYNTLNQIGDIYLQGAAQDDEKRMKAISANNQTSLAEAEGAMKATSTNAALQDKDLTRQAEKDIYAARLNMSIDQARDAATSANMTSLFDNLGAMGKEKKEIGLAALKALGEGKLTAEQLAGYAKIFPDLAKLLGYKGAYGGKLRKKKGYTI